MKQDKNLTLKILNYIEEHAQNKKPLNIGRLVEVLGVGEKKMEYHLSMLKAGGYIQTDQHGITSLTPKGRKYQEDLRSQL